MNEIAQAVAEEIIETFCAPRPIYLGRIKRKRFSRDTWLLVEARPKGDYQGRHPNTTIRQKVYGSSIPFTCSVAQAGGGAWSYFANFDICDDCILLSAKSVENIIRHRSVYTNHTFEFCDPEFPSNFIEFLKSAAMTANGLFGFAHSRMWRRHERRCRKELPDL